MLLIQVELDLPSSQIMGLYNRMIRKFVKKFTEIQEEELGKDIPPSLPKIKEMIPVEQDLNEELSSAAEEIKQKHMKQRMELELSDLSQ